jgi:hypothetical protein
MLVKTVKQVRYIATKNFQVITNGITMTNCLHFQQQQYRKYDHNGTANFCDVILCYFIIIVNKFANEMTLKSRWKI